MLPSFVRLILEDSSPLLRPQPTALPSTSPSRHAYLSPSFLCHAIKHFPPHRLQSTECFDNCLGQCWVASVFILVLRCVRSLGFISSCIIHERALFHAFDPDPSAVTATPDPHLSLPSSPSHVIAQLSFHLLPSSPLPRSLPMQCYWVVGGYLHAKAYLGQLYGATLPASFPECCSSGMCPVTLVNISF